MTVKKETFPSPECRVVRFDAADIITDSNLVQETAQNIKGFDSNASAPSETTVGNQQ